MVLNHRPRARFARIILVTALTIVLTACPDSSRADDANENQEAVPDALDQESQPEGQDSESPGSDPEAPRVVPPLQLPLTAPGSDQAAAALLDELDRFITADQSAAGVPWPDLRNPDPVHAYMAAANFQQWMSMNNPTPSLVEAYTAPASPERGWDLAMFDQLHRLNLRSGPATPPYSMRVQELVHPAATGITDALLAQVPEGSAAVVYFDSVGPSDNFTVDGQYWSTDQGWAEVGPWVAIMAPTDVGWQVWWDELTEPPPPGSRQNQGTPREGDTRRDV